MSSSLDESIHQAQIAQRKRRFWSVAGAICIVLAAILFVVTKGVDQSPGVEQATLSGNSQLGLVDVTREQVKILLNQVNQSFHAVEKNVELSRWDSVQIETIKRELDKAHNLYSQQDYAQAFALLEGISDSLESYEKDYYQDYTGYFQQALNAFDDNQVEQAQRLNQEALARNSQFSEALELQQRLNVANQIETLEQALSVAQVENDRETQIQLLKDIVQLDPQQTDSKQQLQRLVAQQKEELFAQHFSIADQALKVGDIDGAKRELAKLKQIAPSRNEVSLLSNRINHQVNQRSEADLEQQIALFIQSDEWSTVSLLADKGLKQFPNNELMQQALQSARSISSANQLFDRFMDNSARLRDANIRTRAEQAIERAELELALSDKLAVKSEQLLALIEAENQPVSVQITSDNRTMLKVLGVGIVGQVKEKIIQLKPGSYKIEGTREGFKTVIADLLVTPDQQAIQIEVVCLERI